MPSCSCAGWQPSRATRCPPLGQDLLRRLRHLYQHRSIAIRGLDAAGPPGGYGLFPGRAQLLAAENRPAQCLAVDRGQVFGRLPASPDPELAVSAGGRRNQGIPGWRSLPMPWQ